MYVIFLMSTFLLLGYVSFFMPFYFGIIIVLNIYINIAPHWYVYVCKYL